MAPHLVYQLFCGRLESANIQAHEGQVLHALAQHDWLTLKNAGFNTVYLLGVFDYRGPIVVTEENGKPLQGNRIESPFAISNHTAIDPRLGTKDDLISLIQSIQTQGLHVWLDFVPNHTGLAHEWIKKHPDYYYDTQEFSGDVKKLNYQHPEVHQHMLEVLQFITSLGADGVRCDMAHLIPKDFWRSAIPLIKARTSHFIFIAEAYANTVFDWNALTEMREVGFDYVYEEFLYRNIHTVWDDHKPFAFFEEHVNYLLKRGDQKIWLHYLANHDDTLGSNLLPYVQPLTALLLMMNGAFLIPNGMLWGKSNRLSHHQVDILPLQTCELSGLPSWYSHLVAIVTKLQPKLDSVRMQDDGLLTAVVTINHKPGWFVANLGVHDIVPQNIVKMDGIIRNLQAISSFRPGDYELFFKD